MPQNFDVLPERCPKCGDNLIHNDRGIECGALFCNYYAGGEPFKPSDTQQMEGENMGAETPEDIYESLKYTFTASTATQYFKHVNDFDKAMRLVEHYRKQVKLLREALEPLGLAQSRMLDKWSDGDQAVKDRLWKDLHSKEDQWRDALENHNKWSEEETNESA